MHVETCAPLVSILLSLSCTKKESKSWPVVAFKDYSSRGCVLEEEKGSNLMDPWSKSERKQHVYIMETDSVGFIINYMHASRYK